jgi:hypothetical protein
MLGPPPNFRAARVLFWISAVGFGSLGVVWAASGNTLPVGRIAVAAIIGAVAAASLAWVLWELQIREKGGSSQPVIATPPSLQTPMPTPQGGGGRADEMDRIFVRDNITPSYLVNIFRDNIDIEATAQTKKFIGKWMKVDGTVRDIYTLGSDTVTVVLVLDPDSDHGVDISRRAPAALFFREPWIEKILILKRGDEVSGIGKIDTINSMRVRKLRT